MEDPSSIRETSHQKIQETKRKIKEFQQYLSQQIVECEKEQEKKNLQKIRNELAKKHHKNRFSSFTNSMHRPSFIYQIKENELFDNKSVFINKEIPQLTNLQRSLLISPERNQNPSYIKHQLDRPTNKQKSEFPAVRKRFLSQQEIDRIEFWDRNFSQLQEIEQKEKCSLLIGKIKKQLLEQREVKVFKPTDQCLRYFDKNISLISETLITCRQFSKEIGLPKIKEPKVWIPTNNHF
ncbi:unnamed protein product (macronuclear) [Paramecium tetraurelia]|uniref:Uncharacterized protein n=1 Tax=Paramecium tetraurelia TaxID=5888 RepID=A0CVM8_PARTE|nr:uncharacterized protein GSPATT00011013001 [Paramecium tetraurelia]CAK74845.1 unnamed protein product [Paramecium tetraurelia]|eukprot:XP_001442242.1 hypothetical protein (macronuclear) [Paramecium tetraurelia strain d4-2]